MGVGAAHPPPTLWAQRWQRLSRAPAKTICNSGCWKGGRSRAAASQQGSKWGWEEKCSTLRGLCSPRTKVEGNKNPRRHLWWELSTKMFCSCQSKQIQYWHTYLACTCTRRWGTCPFQGRDLHQTADYWRETGSSACPGTRPASSAARDEHKKQRIKKHFSISTKEIIKRRHAGKQQGHPCFLHQPHHEAGSGAQCCGYHRSLGLQES